MHRRWPMMAFAAMLAVGLAFGSAHVASGSDNDDWRQKVDPAVLEAASLGSAEFVIHLTEQADVSGAAALETKEEKGRFVYERLTAVARATQPAVTGELDRLGAPHREFWIVNAIAAAGNLATVQAVAERPDVARVYAVGSGRLDPPEETTIPVGPDSTSLVDLVGPSINHVKANQAWALGARGQGVTVAGADTGVRWTHNALKRNYRGWNGDSNLADHNYNWHDAIKNPNAACPAAPPIGASPQPCDDDLFFGGGHGTHTVGTIAGDDGGANQIGMAPDAKWIACRNMNHGLGVVPTYLDCMQWFLAPTNLAGQNPDPSKAPDVVNNSWACVEGCASPLLKQQVDASRAAGIFYAVSAGNDGSQCSTIAFPLAVYDSSFTVGATGATNDNIASFSSRGPVLANPIEGILRKPDIVAPGQGIRSSLRANDNAYGNLSGTSMSGPHVAGLVALIISANPQLRGDVDRVEQIIRDTAVPRTTTQGCGGDSPTQVPNNVYGYGRIDALAAVQRALPPTAVDDTAATEEETPVTVAVLANDTDPTPNDVLSVADVGDPANGTAVANPDGTVTYTPDAGFAGTDTFTYRVKDAAGNFDDGAVSVDVDAGDIPGACGEIDDSSSRVAYRQGWDVFTSTAATGGSYHRRNGSSGGLGSMPTATVEFAGDRVGIAYGVSASGGTADVLVDGQLKETLSFAGPGLLDAPTFGRTAVYRNLGDGSHTLTVRYRSGAVYLDGFGFDC